MIKKYIYLFLRYLGIEISKMSAYKANLVIYSIFSIISDLLGPFAMYVVYNVSNGIPGWSFYEILFFQGCLIFVFGFSHFAFMPMTWRTSRNIQYGIVDQMLIRPVNTLALISVSNPDVDGFASAVLGVVLMTYSAVKINAVFSVINMIYFIVLMLCGIIFYYSFAVIITGISFIIVKSQALLEAFWTVESFAQYPFAVYSGPVVLFLTFVIPFGLAGNYPATALLKGMDSLFFFELVGITFLFLFFSIKVWDYCLSRYTSAGG